MSEGFGAVGWLEVLVVVYTKVETSKIVTCLGGVGLP